MAGDPIYLVEGAPDAPDDARLVSEEEARAAGTLLPLRLDEILYVAATVAERFAAEVCPVQAINSILEFAGVVLSFQAETTAQLRGHDNMNEDYLVLSLPTREELALPPGVNVDKCVLIVADCTSKDQGWATDGREHNNTYRACWSWNELAVSKRNADGETVEAKRVGFCSNHRADRAFRRHRRIYSAPNAVLEAVAPGDEVRIVLRSQFPGWTNTATFASLSVSFAVEFEDLFSFEDIPFPDPAERHAVPSEAESAISCCLQ